MLLAIGGVSYYTMIMSLGEEHGSYVEGVVLSPSGE